MGDYKHRTDAELKEAKPNNNPPIYTSSILLAYRLARYMYTQDNIVWTNSAGEQKGKPYTVAGGKAATGLSVGHRGAGSPWDHYRDGDMDHIPELCKKQPIKAKDGKYQNMTLMDAEDKYIPYMLYLLGDPDAWEAEDIDKGAKTEEYRYTYYSDIIGRFLALIEAQREQDLYVKGRTTDIFIHTSRYGWENKSIIETRHQLSDADAQKMLDEYYSVKRLK